MYVFKLFKILHVIDSCMVLNTFIAMKMNNCHILCAMVFDFIMTIFYLQLIHLNTLFARIVL